MHARRVGLECCDRYIDLCPGKATAGQQGVYSDYAQTRFRQLPGKVVCKARSLYELSSICDSECKLSRSERWICSFYLNRTTKLVQRATQRRCQSRAAWSRNNSPAASHHQRIVERDTQARERIADSRWSHVKPARCARHTPFGKDGFEHDKQIQIKPR